jgi:hypothetical protein
MRASPRVLLEELGADEVTVRIEATPATPADGPQLASEVLEAIAPYAAGARAVSGDHHDNGLGSRAVMGDDGDNGADG